jgi:hypothetical protein
MCQLRTVVCLASLLLFSTAASAQVLPPTFSPQQDVINTFAGGGPNNVPATSASIAMPLGVAVDSSGNYYYTTNAFAYYVPRVFKVNTSGTLTVFAGNGGTGDRDYSGDGGPAAEAELNQPWGVAADSFGNVYIADTNNCVIRKVDRSGTISTFAGTPPSFAYGATCGYGGDGGAATSAILNCPYGVAVDKSGNVYIADTDNYRIREVTVSNGEINTVAGGSYCVGAGAACGDGGPATSAGISQVFSLALDGSGNVYIADAYNYEIREFSVGGNITTVAGNGTCGYSGDGGAATSAELAGPMAVAVDSPGNIFIADTGNYRIRAVTVSNGKINSVAGAGSGCPGQTDSIGDGCAATSAEISSVQGVAVDSSDDIFIADLDNLAIREVTASNGIINTVAGNGLPSFTGNGIPATNAALNTPWGATSDSAGNIYIADQYNCIVREVNATTRIITTIAGTPGSCGYSGDGGPATSAQLNWPSRVALHAGKVYIADTWNAVVREVDATGTITTFAGGPPETCEYPGDGGPATSACLYHPYGLAVDRAGNVYIADSGNSRIREVSDGIINTVAGGGTGCPGQTDTAGDGCPATSASLNLPEDVAADALGNLYIADTDSHRIRMVNTRGIISTFAGGGSTLGDGGPANEASLFFPQGVAVDAAGDVLIADTFNRLVRWVDGESIIHTVAGCFSCNPEAGFFGDGGLGTGATLWQPTGVGVDPSGNIYVADTNNDRVRKVNAVAGLNASTTNVTFGFEPVGMSSSPQTVTLSAIGPLSIDYVTVTGDFTESNDCPMGTTMSGQCEVRIVFKPTRAGLRSGTVTIWNNGYFSRGLVIDLKGTGIAARPLP